MKLKKGLRSEGVENIIFDFGGVITDIDINKTIDAFRNLGLTGFDPRDIHPDNTGVFLDLELGDITDEDFFKALQGYAAPGTTPPSEQQLRRAWNELILDFDMRRFALLDELRKNYKIFLLSNTNLPHREYFIDKFNREAAGGRTFESYFDRCFYSDAMHLRKPEAEIYAAVVRETGIEAAKSLFVDDNAPNLVGAKEVGMLTCHMAPGLTVFDLLE